MKAHGIEKSSPAGASGPSTPASGRKTAGNRTTPASKKRKMAARGDDVDEDDDVKPDIKPDIKDEVKLEESTNAPDGSYILDPNNPPIAAPAVEVPVKTPAGADLDGGSNDDVLLVSESRREDGAAPMALAHQVPQPPPPRGFYGFVDPATSLHHPTQQPMPAIDVPIRYEYGHADYATQTMATVSPDGRHWLHQHDPVFFWSDVHLEPHFNIKHD